MTSQTALRSDCIALGLDIDNRKALFHWASLLFAEKFGIDPDACATVLSARERLGSTALDNGTAIPHAPIDGLKYPIACFARLARPIAFSSSDSRDVDIAIAVLLPRNRAANGFSIISHLAKRLRDDAIANALRQAPTAQDVQDLLSLPALDIDQFD